MKIHRTCSDIKKIFRGRFVNNGKPKIIYKIVNIIKKLTLSYLSHEIKINKITGI